MEPPTYLHWGSEVECRDPARAARRDPEILSIVKIFGNKDSPPSPALGLGEVHSPSPEEQFPPSLGHPSRGLFLFCLLPGLTEGLVWLEAAADVVREWGMTQEDALRNEQVGELWPRTRSPQSAPL